MIRLADMLTVDRCVMLADSDKEAVLARLVSVLATSDAVGDAEELLEAIRGRELIMSTGIGFGLAVPHAKIPSVSDITLAVGISATGIPFASLDETPVYIVVMIAGGANQQDKYIRTLARVMLVLKNPETRRQLIEADSEAAVFDIFKRY